MQCAPTTRTLLSKYFMQNVSSSLAYSIMVSPHQPGTRSLGPKPPRPCSQTSHGSPQPRIESNRVGNSAGKTLRLHSGLGPGSHRARVSPSPSSPCQATSLPLSPCSPFPSALSSGQSILIPEASAAVTCQVPVPPLDHTGRLLCSPRRWWPLRGRPLPEAGLGLTQTGPWTRGPTARPSPSHAFTLQILATTTESGFSSARPHFSHYETEVHRD